MKRPTRRQLAIGAIAVLIVVAVIYAFLPDPVPVDTAVASRGPLRVIVEEEAETFLQDQYVVSSPVPAYAQRIELEAGDMVEQGQPLVRLEPPRATLLDPRTRAQAEARVIAARAAVQEAAVVAEQAAEYRDRIRTLWEAGAVPLQQYDDARSAAARASATLEAARAELSAAEATAATPASGGAVPATLTAPASGRVLTVHRQSEGHVNPGEPLMLVGDTRQIEIRADVLSQDAVRIQSGTPVIVDEWGGDTELEAIVTRVEPQGTTEISALGVEEQRVPVRANLTSPPSAWANLGSGYRVLARFIVWQEGNVLRVPTSALFRYGDEWRTFVVEDGRARLRSVEVGQQAGLTAQIVGGLVEGERIIVHPPNEIDDGTRVAPRMER